MAMMTVGSIKKMFNDFSNDFPDDKNILVSLQENSKGLEIMVSEDASNPIICLNGKMISNVQKVDLNWETRADTVPHNSFSIVYFDEELGGSRIVGVHK